MSATVPESHIGSLNEKPLHAALKQWLATPGDTIEVKVDGYFIDVVQGECLVEIQTKSFASMKRKLFDLVERHPVRLVHPIAREKWIVKGEDGGEDASAPSRRKSPKRGAVVDVFEELVAIPTLIDHPNFTLVVLLIQEEEVRRYDPSRNWRRKGWATHERRLLDVVEEHTFHSPEELAGLLPATLPASYTTADLAKALGKPRRLAQQMAYCLREAGAIEATGKQGRAMLYTRKPAAEVAPRAGVSDTHP